MVLLVGSATFVLGAVRTLPCGLTGWRSPDRYEWMCYSDIPVLYSLRGIVDGALPYLGDSGTQPLEYPVLTAAFAWLAALLTPSHNSAAFYWVNVVLLLACFLVALAATALTVPQRVWDGLLLALAPSVLLAGLINWDWFPVALTSVGLLAWSRSRPGLAGVLLGLAIAAKFYPVVIFGPMALLCWRRRRLPAYGKAFGAAALTWLVVNIPFALAAPEEWSYFFRFSSERGEDYGSVWLALSQLGIGIDAESLNTIAMAVLAVLCAAIAWITLRSPTPPRLAQLAFLVVAAFLVTNKVYSPQYVLWLLPLAVLARPRWRDFLIWQATEVVYFAAIWWYFAGLEPDTKALSIEAYTVAIGLHIAGVAYLSAVVVRDIWRPRADPVRADRAGAALPAGDGLDDPGGGVLDGAPDRMAGAGRVYSPTM